jgi:hypothetical protein
VRHFYARVFGKALSAVGGTRLLMLGAAGAGCRGACCGGRCSPPGRCHGGGCRVFAYCSTVCRAEGINSSSTHGRHAVEIRKPRLLKGRGFRG